MLTPRNPAGDLIRTPFKDAGVFKQQPDTIWHTLKRTTEAGEVKPPEVVPPAFLRAQKANSISHPELPTPEPPHWARLLITSKASPADMAAAAVERALKLPNEATLREVEGVLNEMGRDRDKAAAMARLLTPETIARVMKRE